MLEIKYARDSEINIFQDVADDDVQPDMIVEGK